MVQSLEYLKETASQTAGPYVHIGLIPKQAGFDIFENNFTNIMADENTRGERIIIEGRVIDGTGTPLRDALLEIWQANADGRYNHELDRQNRGEIDANFRGWGRTGTDFETAVYRFETIKPGVVTGRNGRDMAPHVNFWIVARGINIGLNTRMYFADEQNANEVDPVLNLIEQTERRKTLIATRDDSGAVPVYRFDIVLQGENETVFFDI
ncbi:MULTISPECIES: protocatechuate 3,4-dioxygenase subunit alpha [Thalassospira]|jgi:protocatechuate 3,4-dioxygenase alpha subunit|uniref:protocatechuate 3,4-dioxygenase subunit alpha n=1 Tax=Thalassospira TaxID=168934 RepID=UPI001D183E04|nr:MULTISPECIES: protocatechuate 3,4-dioxygenase subunit alpha [Thalassospira]MCC4241679.1 protocatechuate 3,4-dioxygenase subunit alpha [Thalassospira povalilytica]URK16264.1 protocatechuate 3,4-dioxygenase subunit alpha [Thalassospira sp. GO-4]